MESTKGEVIETKQRKSQRTESTEPSSEEVDRIFSIVYGSGYQRNFDGSFRGRYSNESDSKGSTPDSDRVQKQSQDCSVSGLCSSTDSWQCRASSRIKAKS